MRACATNVSHTARLGSCRHKAERHCGHAVCFTRFFSGPWRTRGVGGKPKIVAKRHPSVSNSAWESIFQMNVDCYFTT